MNLDAIKRSESASFKKKNPHIFGPGPIPVFAVTSSEIPKVEEALKAIDSPKRKPKRIRQSEKPLLNKLEAEFLVRLKARSGDAMIYPQGIRLRLANGLTYTPDLFLLHKVIGPYAYEVKGKHAFEDSLVKLKCAATSFPLIRFYLVWKDDTGQWQEQHVLP